jgi:hypothetical protein
MHCVSHAAIEGFVEMASQDASTASAALLKDRSSVQSCIGEAEAILNASRVYVIGAVERAWAATCEAATDPAQEIAQACLAITHSIHEAVRVVSLLFRAAGATQCGVPSPL